MARAMSWQTLMASLSLVRPASDATRETEYEQQVIIGNVYRVKTQLMMARELRKLVELEKALARQRMGQGSDGGASKSADRAGAAYKLSGKTVERRAERRGDKVALF